MLEFVRSHLYDPASGHILHHFIDGRIALPSDPEYFCTGCNLQFLYALFLLQQARLVRRRSARLGYSVTTKVVPPGPVV